MLYNPDFNCTEFDTIRNAAWSNNLGHRGYLSLVIPFLITLLYSSITYPY